MIKTIGSVCSGIEAASVAWNSLEFQFDWFSEIATFPSMLLQYKYPNIKNLQDMTNIPELIREQKISTPDLICGGTPCQAFSLAGEKKGLEDERGNLTLKFVEIIEENDLEREKKGLKPTIVFWENVEGVLADKTNAFGCFISALAGFSDVIEKKRWANAGFIRGKKRNVAWRVLDAKFFGVPQQRKRLYVLAGGTDFYPEDILFEKYNGDFDVPEFPALSLVFEKEDNSFEIFRNYTDCLYSAYGTKWNGNAAAYNGSLFVVQNKKIRRMTPLECERLMGFPDNYTDIPKATNTTRYQAIGNSWAIPVIKWIGERIINYQNLSLNINVDSVQLHSYRVYNEFKHHVFEFHKDNICIDGYININIGTYPNNIVFSNLSDIISPDAPESLYISPVGCSGIIRRKTERNIKMNQRLEVILLSISSQMSFEEIEKKSRIQQRGLFSINNSYKSIHSSVSTTQPNLFK